MIQNRTGTKSDQVVVIGADLWLSITVIDQEGDVVDLTGASYKALVKSSEDDVDASAVAEFTISSSAPTTGNIDMILSDTETVKLQDEHNYVYDLHIKLPSNHATYPNFDEFPIWGTLRAIMGSSRSV